jgi:ABC-type transport system involved in multi-copper enzyme maturation permease subunit
MTPIPTLLVYGVLLVLVQALAALPWVFALLGSHDTLRRVRGAGGWGDLVKSVLLFLGVVVAGGVVPAVVLRFVQDAGTLEIWGHAYGAILQLQLTLDFFLLLFAALMPLWPKGGAVALAAFRESLRQPKFWLLFGLAVVLLTLSPFVPYFTFGEDHIVVKELGYDTIMLVAVLLGALSASMSISEEIEGRTAITVMSKPVSRREFLLGKFAGILLASVVLMGLLTVYFQAVLLYKDWFERRDPVPTPPELVAWLERWAPAGEPFAFTQGIGLWFLHTLEVLPGMVLCFNQVMVLVALNVALVTRLPMIVNLVTCLVVFFLANLSPVLVQSTQPANPDTAGAVQQLLHFIARLFDAVLPALQHFTSRTSLIGDQALPWREYLSYVGSVTGLGLLYTVVILLIGLVLFEDRDLA